VTRTPPVKRPSLLLPLFRLAAVSVLAALMLWIILSDPNCWRQLWPDDIQAGLLHWTGGQLRTDAADRVHSEPSFAGLLLAVGLPLAVAAVMQRTSQAGAGVAELARRTLPCVFFAGVWLLLWLVSPLFLGVNFTQFLCTTAAFSMALLLALLWNALPVPAERGGVEAAGTGGPATVVAGSRRSLLVVLLAAVLWQSASFLLNRSLYDNLLVPHGDSAMYEEHLWNTWHGKGFRSYLDQGLFLGEHIQVVHLLLLPLHMLWPHYLLLEWLSTACLAICVVPIFSMARRWSGSSQAALWLALAWLLYFPMHYLDIAIDLKTLRPSCYGLPALFWGIDLAERRRLKSASVCFLIALLTQEDFALITGGIGLVLWVLRWRTAELDQRAIARWSAGLAVASAAWVLLATLVVLARWKARHEDMSGARRAPLRDVGRYILVAAPALVLPFLIRSAVGEGVATATEVSTVAVIYALFVGQVLYGGIGLRKFYSMLVETAALSGAVLLVLGAASAMAWSITQSGVVQQLSQFMTTLPGGWMGFMALTIVVFLVLGCLLEGLPAVLLLAPIMFPIARKLGIHDIHYSMVIVCAMNIGLMMPPIGVGFYIACRIGGTKPDEVIGAIWPYLVALLVGVIIIAAVPWISTVAL